MGPDIAHAPGRRTSARKHREGAQFLAFKTVGTITAPMCCVRRRPRHPDATRRKKDSTQMNAQTLKRLGWMTASIGLTTVFGGCQVDDMDGDGTQTESAAYETSNGLAGLNGFAGMNVPLWLDSGSPSIGWGQNSAYPVQEAAYFGDVMRANADGTVHAWYCEGRNYKNGIVPGRLGAGDGSGIYKNPWGAGALC